jgi:hypothetical protein
VKLWAPKVAGVPILAISFPLGSPGTKCHLDVGLVERRNVATPLLEECEDDTHTFEMRTWESSGTPKTLKFDCRGPKHLALRRFSCHWKAIEV